MANAEFGSGRGGFDTINVTGSPVCPKNCPFCGEGNKRFKCIKNNGDATVFVYGGINRYTLTEFKQVAPCLNVSPHH